MARSYDNKNHKRKYSSAATLTLVLIAAVIYWFISPSGKSADTSSAKKSTSSSSSVSTAGDGLLTAEFLDVGQGDCTFFTLPDGKTLLVDGANPGDGEKITNYLKNKGVEKIDYLVATHPHADHIGGLADIINALNVGKVFAPKLAQKDIPTTKCYENFLLAVQNKGLKITAAQNGLLMFEGDGYKAECFAPNGKFTENLNNYSVCFRLTYGDDSFLMTADAEKVVEDYMLNAGYDLDVDVFKAAHHGSSSGNSKRFLNAVSPEYAVISCGKDNSYGHPHKETLQAFKNLKGLKKYYRTDLDGTVIITADGKGDINASTK